jgi:hypothetical protein
MSGAIAVGVTLACIVTATLFMPTGVLLMVLAALVAVGLFVAPKPALAVLAVFLVVQSILTELVGGRDSIMGSAIQRLDEALVVAGMIRVAVMVWLGRTSRPLVHSSLWLGAFIAAGLVSSLIHAVPLPVTVLGAFLAGKFGLLLLLSLSIRWVPRDAERLGRWILWGAPMLLLLGLLRWVLPTEWQSALTTPGALAEGGFSRGGLASMQGPFDHPGVFGWAMALISCYALAAIVAGSRRTGVIALASSLVGIIASLRRKPLLGLVAAGAAMAMKNLTLRQRGVLLVVGVGVVAGIGLFGRERVRVVVADAIASYADPYSPSTARGLLYATGWELAANGVPLGAGFGRFGGYASQVYYSPVYTEYGLSAIYGLSPDNPAYLQDTYWPHVLGETGWAGTVILLGFLVFLWRQMQHRTGPSGSVAVRMLALGASAALVEALVESVASPLFEASLPAFALAVPIGMVLGMPGSSPRHLPPSPGESPELRDPGPRLPP